MRRVGRQAREDVAARVLRLRQRRYEPVQQQEPRGRRVLVDDRERGARRGRRLAADDERVARRVEGGP